MGEVYRLLFFAVQIHYKTAEFMNETLIWKIAYDFAIHHLKITSYEDELFRSDINQYIYSDRSMEIEPVMGLKWAAAETFCILSKLDEKFL